MQLPMVRSAEDLERLVEETGLLPFFRCTIPGFSLEECTPPGHWFESGVEGPWEWREKVAAGGRIAYGKLFNKKAGFVSMKWYPDLCNYRRDGYDFDARYEDGLATRKCRLIMDALAEHGPLLSREIKRLAGFGKDGEKGYETAVTTLQMQAYVSVKEFVYNRDRHGKAYGWGIGRYDLVENLFGEQVSSMYEKKPEESKALLVQRISQICPHAGEAEITRLIR